MLILLLFGPLIQLFRSGPTYSYSNSTALKYSSLRCSCCVHGKTEGDDVQEQEDQWYCIKNLDRERSGFRIVVREGRVNVTWGRLWLGWGGFRIGFSQKRTANVFW
mmetsp:Transcript_32385/g.47909  ORF Transcript_32385/g.47909 Transcript_32385/m.47909 type:complete len:106 (-) Transcript_32385:433-750(-)